MHPHSPNEQDGHRLSIGRLLVEVAMIVFSILLVLSLESCHESRRHAEVAATALARIRAELGENAKHVKQRLPLHQAVAAVFTRRAAHPDVRIAAEDTLPLGLNPPFLSTTAFETALSTQALGYMNYDDVLAISRAYTAQHRMAMIENNWLPMLISPMAFDNKRRSQFYSLQAGLLMEYVVLENTLLSLYDEADVRLGRGKQPRP